MALWNCKDALRNDAQSLAYMPTSSNHHRNKLHSHINGCTACELNWNFEITHSGMRRHGKMKRTTRFMESMSSLQSDNLSAPTNDTCIEQFTMGGDDYNSVKSGIQTVPPDMATY